MWPLSHYKQFVDDLCAVEDVKARPATKKQEELSEDGAMKAAVITRLVNNPSIYQLINLRN